MALWFVNVLSLSLLQAISSVTCRLNSNKCPLFLLQASRNKHLYIFTWCSSPACWVRAPCCKSPPLFYLVRTSLSHSRQRRELFSGSGWLVVGFFFKRVKKRGPDSCGEDFWDAFLEKTKQRSSIFAVENALCDAARGREPRLERRSGARFAPGAAVRVRPRGGGTPAGTPSPGDRRARAPTRFPGWKAWRRRWRPAATCWVRGKDPSGEGAAGGPEERWGARRTKGAQPSRPVRVLPPDRPRRVWGSFSAETSASSCRENRLGEKPTKTT